MTAWTEEMAAKLLPKNEPLGSVTETYRAPTPGAFERTATETEQLLNGAVECVRRALEADRSEKGWSESWPVKLGYLTNALMLLGQAKREITDMQESIGMRPYDLKQSAKK